MAKTLKSRGIKKTLKKATGKLGFNVSLVPPATSTNFATAANNTDANGEFTINKGGSILRYPKNETQEELGYDYLKICAYEYQPRTFGVNEKGGALESNVDYDSDDYENALTGDYEESVNLIQKKDTHTVFLPMDPSGLAEINNVNWQDKTMNPLDAALANMSGAAVEGAGKGAKQAGKAVAESTGEAFNSLKDAAGADNAIAAFFAGQASQNKEVFTCASGMVVNNNLELLFEGPQLRSFNYNFKFTPRDQDEANEIRKIIKFFKKAIAPQRSEGKMFLKSPHVFKLEYIYKNGEQHPFLNKMKMCVCKNFGVTYAPDGSYMTYDDGSMTSYNVSLGFGEMNPIYADNIIESSNDMSY